jgi:MYXO-CTERM domain-containing protein
MIGFRFVSSAGTTHYGWMRFAMGAPGSAGTAMTRTVVDYAYESVAGTSIAAGVPAPGALALLGVAGLAGARRRR